MNNKIKLIIFGLIVISVLLVFIFIVYQAMVKNNAIPLIIFDLVGYTFILISPKLQKIKMK